MSSDEGWWPPSKSLGLESVEAERWWVNHRFVNDPILVKEALDYYMLLMYRVRVAGRVPASAMRDHEEECCHAEG